MSLVKDKTMKKRPLCEIKPLEFMIEQEYIGGEARFTFRMKDGMCWQIVSGKGGTIPL